MTLESEGAKIDAKAERLSPGHGVICAERQRLSKVFERVFAVFALLMPARRGRPQTAIQGQALQDGGRQCPGLQKDLGALNFDHKKWLAFPRPFGRTILVMKNVYHSQFIPCKSQFETLIYSGWFSPCPEISLNFRFVTYKTISRTSFALNLAFSSQTAHLLSNPWIRRCPLTIPRSLARNTRLSCPGSL